MYNLFIKSGSNWKKTSLSFESKKAGLEYLNNSGLDTLRYYIGLENSEYLYI